jgi:hypothetical protein
MAKACAGLDPAPHGSAVPGGASTSIILAQRICGNAGTDVAAKMADDLLILTDVY